MRAADASAAIRVLVADDNATVRRAIRLRLHAAPDMVSVGEVTNGTDAVAVARRERPDVVLMDLQMPGGSGLAATRALGADDDAPRILVLTNHSAHAYVVEALEAGAVGYLLKTHDGRDLLAAIRAAHRGEGYVSSRVTMPVLRELTERRTIDPNSGSVDLLSRAELAVVATLAGGTTSNEEIAAALHLSVNTVRSHLSAALHKTGTVDRTQLALWAVRRRIGAGNG